MNVNEYGQVSFTTQEVIDSIYAGSQDVINMIDDVQEIDQHNQHCDALNVMPIEPQHKIHTDATQFHHTNASNWHMPDNYKNLDIMQWLTEKLVELRLTDSRYVDTLSNELQEYQQRNMMDLLKFLKYMMDTCQEHDIVTGVGRGSSVASLVLYLLGVHAIDPIKYNLDYTEFLR